jgi:hypothetical protein
VSLPREGTMATLGDQGRSSQIGRGSRIDECRAGCCPARFSGHRTASRPSGGWHHACSCGPYGRRAPTKSFAAGSYPTSYRAFAPGARPRRGPWPDSKRS